MARIAELGRRVWFLRKLVEAFEWAQTFVGRYPVQVIDDLKVVVDCASVRG